ncbi:MarR family winged helix-turn-helix transcriptional regulator [Ideonella sp. DXS22W]|uniref:MarR family winged helix-turn-helix transcriptional regulator n=1 Tax=Pseudaquabacterium inlustre TaxID=2984192 RepID=A0ABU9CHB2_9BURK
MPPRALQANDSPADDDAAAAMPAPQGCSNFRLRQADRVVSRFYDSHLLPRTGLKTSQYSLLSHIAALAPVQPAVLAQHMGLEPSTLTRNLQPLVAQGWVQVGPGHDARSRAIVLTDAGLAKRQDARRAWKAAQLAFNARIGAERVAQLHALLDDCMRLMGPEPLDAGTDDRAATAPASPPTATRRKGARHG